MKTTYDDIIDLPHHVSKVHPQMSMYNRTAQFAPFAALTGHEDAIRETARQTDEDKELSESEAEILNRKLTYLILKKEEKPAVSVTYFVEDGRKSGGNYRTATGIIKRIDTDKGILEMAAGLSIPIGSIKDIDGECFED